MKHSARTIVIEITRVIAYNGVQITRKGMLAMRSYYAKYRRGSVVPLGVHDIPDGSDLLITVLEPMEESRSHRQRRAFVQFMEDMDNTPPLPPEFDEALSQRVNFTREIELY